MSLNSSLTTNLHFAPLLDTNYLLGITFIGAILLIISFFKYRNGTMLRLLMFFAFMLALLNPSLLQEERQYAKDTAIIVVDNSQSQTFEKRNNRTERALSSLKKQIEAYDNIDLRILKTPKDGQLQSRTDLFSELDNILADIPSKRRAGVIFLSDGQIHDAPKNTALYDKYGPVHALLSGKKSEKDRQIIITQAPAYGIVGNDITIKYRVEDTKNIGKANADITITMHDGLKKHINVPVNQEHSLDFTLKHPSQNIFTIEASSINGEITLANNRAAILINGVRDRLKVLLVSGLPHSGERTWRNLLTSDPGVDLVHFTILREPEKFDYTPKKEMSLIPFPFRELFEVKIYDFDLIIFDRYRVNNILPKHYFRNITRYVKNGGAFLESSGPAFAGNRSIYSTPLKDILPGKPTGGIVSTPFYPSITNLGHKHPVTRSLIWNNVTNIKGIKPSWGQWMRQIDITAIHGDILMEGANKMPLLLLSRLEKGRVAQIASDQIWLWSRGYDGGGPHAELLRRTVHWLMKEPELDELAMDIFIHKNTITIRKQDLNQGNETVFVTLPEGENIIIELKPDGAGFISHRMDAVQLGIHAFEDAQGSRKFAIIGDLNPPELSGVKTTPKILEPLVTATHGATIWLEDTPEPKIHLSSAGQKRYGGNNWLSLRQNKDYTVAKVTNTTLMPEWMILLTLLSLLIFMWWREGKPA